MSSMKDVIVKKIISLREDFHDDMRNKRKHFNDCYDRAQEEIRAFYNNYKVLINIRVVLMSDEDYDMHVELGTISEFISYPDKFIN